MKLLLDENLSDRIIHRIIDLYPDSEHVKTLTLTNTDDVVIWGNRSGGGQKNVRYEITRNQYENQSRFDFPRIIVSS